MLIVAGSGLIGRYLYARIHHGLYGQKATLNELRSEAERLKNDSAGAGKLLPEFAERLDDAEARINRGVPLVPKAFSAAILFGLGRWNLRHYAHKTLKGAAAESAAIAAHRATLAQTMGAGSSAPCWRAREAKPLAPPTVVADIGT